MRKLDELKYLPLKPVERSSLAVDGWDRLACAQEVWGDGTLLTKEKGEKIVDKARAQECFFWPLREGMSFEAAKVLQEREAANQELKRSNLYTKIALAIATIGLVASVVSNCSGF
ncbi:hypothetical protein [Candidatus Rariloculus sp.]|uniref:hypothetical protein n=1 Tax=Candidatus Rariloculus sp. TaxID=3101265 RepID=UPI003D14C051